MHNHDGEDSNTIDGEVVGDTPGTALEPSRTYSRYSRGDGGAFSSPYSREDVEHAIHLRAIGFTVSEITQKMSERLGRPVPHSTVRGWFERHIGMHHPARINLADVQAGMVVELQAMQHEAMRVVRLYPGTELALRGLAQARNILATRADLLGIEPPKKIDADADEAAGADAALIALVEEARQEAWAEADRVRAGYARENNLGRGHGRPAPSEGRTLYGPGPE